MTSTAPIGVFDSGLGGISVVRQIVQDMPHERVLYFGDSANAPYGTKTPQEVRRLSFDIMERFMSQGVKAVVIACNTATSAAVNALRDHYDIPIIGMEPALKVACDRGDTAAGDGTAPARHMPQHVIVAATPLTLREHKFAALMDRFKANNMISPQPCPDLVKIVESGPSTRWCLAARISCSTATTSVSCCRRRPRLSTAIAERSGIWAWFWNRWGSLLPRGWTAASRSRIPIAANASPRCHENCCTARSSDPGRHRDCPHNGRTLGRHYERGRR